MSFLLIPKEDKSKKKLKKEKSENNFNKKKSGKNIQNFGPNSDQIRTALFLLTNKSSRKSINEIKKELKEIIESW